VSGNRSFAHAVIDAIDGIYHTLVEQPNFRIQVVVTVLAVVGGIALKFGPWQWSVVTLACAFVLGAELFNTGLEHAIDLYKPENHPLARAAKHAGAAAVLIAALAAAIVGVCLYGTALFGK
jgi:diacylglycerol kinase